jgi:predicted HTH domain antitoxin
MVHTLTINKTELARRTRQIVERARRGEAIIVESYGEEQVAVIDAIDYRIMRAVLSYHAQTPEIAPLSGLADERVTALTDPQDRFDLVLAHYLAEAINLGRAAKLLDIYRLDLQDLFARLEVPLRIGPANLAEARAEVEAIRAMFPDMPAADKRKRQAAIHAYTAGEISLGKAAETLGISHEEMKDILREKGAEIHLGPETVEELLQDAANA